ncbi:hypothetical protein CCR75_006705 [Bremia lactucae]|uniref:Uncharacterized protein n=1 Tax=Bremia lactucae TaxID=4779 RepID=A0A976FEP8_BRELC|nr:hypothetical protein CCR75_006705 [Bremia lactucae]
MTGSSPSRQFQEDRPSLHRYEPSDSLRQCSGCDNEMRASEALQWTSESFRDTTLDLYAASKVFGIHLITFEGLFVVLFSMMTTSLY